jgi:hypothetical protein
MAAALENAKADIEKANKALPLRIYVSSGFM